MEARSVELGPRGERAEGASRSGDAVDRFAVHPFRMKRGGPLRGSLADMESPRRLAPPRLRRGIVARARLSRALDRGRDASLTLVVAPAGYGKSVAVQLWLGERGHAAAWLRADARDDDAVRLWSSLAAAVEHVRPGAGDDALAELHEPFTGVLPAIDALAV